jgi:hypothetical protein
MIYNAVFIHRISLNFSEAIILFILRLTTHMKCNQGVAFCVACNGIVALLRCMQHVIVANRIAPFEDSVLEIKSIYVCFR